MDSLTFKEEAMEAFNTSGQKSMFSCKIVEIIQRMELASQSVLP